MRGVSPTNKMLSMPIKELLSRLRDGSFSAKELIEASIRRSVSCKELNCLITSTHDQARSQAEESHKRWKAGEQRKLDGIPIAIKDNFCTRDVPTTCSSNMLRNYVPPYNATVVEKLIKGGSISLGKTNMDEFAMGSGTLDSIFGPVKNPWKYNFLKKTNRSKPGEINSQMSNKTSQKSVHSSESYSRRIANKLHRKNMSTSNTTPPPLVDTPTDDWHVSGGSSGGSAAAVASGITCVALGSDTGGSVRIPASYCGIVGFKPSYGLLSRHGLIPLVNSMDVPGIFTRTIDDTAAVLNILAGPDIRDSTTVQDEFKQFEIPDDVNIEGLHIGIPKEYHAPGTSQEVIDTWRAAADLFEESGAKVSEVSLPHMQYSILCYSVLCCCEVASNMARYDGIQFGHRGNDEQSTESLYAQTRDEGFNDFVRGRIFAGNYFLLRRHYDEYFIRAQKIRRLIADDFNKVFSQGVDVLLTPTTLTDAPTYRDFIQEDSRSRCEETDVYTQPVNLAGIPAVNVPTSISSRGLPIGLQLIGQRFKDEQLLTAAKWLEQQVRFPHLDLEEHLSNFED